MKATNVAAGLTEVEFVSEMNLKTFNPFQNDVHTIQTSKVRQLLDLSKFQTGNSLNLIKNMQLRMNDGRKMESLAALEVRVVDNYFPRTYIARETVFSPSRFSYFFICE